MCARTDCFRMCVSPSACDCAPLFGMVFLMKRGIAFLAKTFCNLGRVFATRRMFGAHSAAMSAYEARCSLLSFDPSVLSVGY